MKAVFGETLENMNESMKHKQLRIIKGGGNGKGKVYEKHQYHTRNAIRGYYEENG